MKEGLGEMKKSVEQHFDQVDTVLAEMKGAYDTMTLQQLFQQSPKVQALFPKTKCLGQKVAKVFGWTVSLMGWCCSTSDRRHCNNLNPLLVSDNSIVKGTILTLYSAVDSTETSEHVEITFEDINVDI